MPTAKNVQQQIFGIGGSSFNVHAKVITTSLQSVISRKHAIGAQRNHLQHLGVGSKEISVEGFTSVPYYESNLWIIEAIQRAGLPVPFVSNAITTLVYIDSFDYTENAERFRSVAFNIKMIEWKPLGSLIGEVVQRTGTITGLSEKLPIDNNPIIIGGVITGGLTK